MYNMDRCIPVIEGLLRQAVAELPSGSVRMIGNIDVRFSAGCFGTVTSPNQMALFLNQQGPLMIADAVDKAGILGLNDYRNKISLDEGADATVAICLDWEAPDFQPPRFEAERQVQ